MSARNVAVTAGKYLLSNGWRGGRDGGRYLLESGQGQIIIDREGVHHVGKTGGLTTVVDTYGMSRPGWEHLCRAVDRLCADGVLPVTVSSGWRAACEAHEALVAAADARAQHLADQLDESKATLAALLNAQPVDTGAALAGRGSTRALLLRDVQTQIRADRGVGVLAELLRNAGMPDPAATAHAEAISAGTPEAIPSALRALDEQDAPC